MNAQAGLIKMLAIVGVVALAFLAGRGSNSAAPSWISITISPAKATLPEGASQSFVATASGLKRSGEATARLCRMSAKCLPKSATTDNAQHNILRASFDTTDRGGNK